MTERIKAFLAMDAIMDEAEENGDYTTYELYEELRYDLLDDLTDEELHFIDKLYDKIYRKDW